MLERQVFHSNYEKLYKQLVKNKTVALIQTFMLYECPSLSELFFQSSQVLLSSVSWPVGLWEWRPGADGLLQERRVPGRGVQDDQKGAGRAGSVPSRAREKLRRWVQLRAEEGALLPPEGRIHLHPQASHGGKDQGHEGTGQQVWLWGRAASPSPTGSERRRLSCSAFWYRFRFWWWSASPPVERPRGPWSTPWRTLRRSTTSWAQTPSWTRWRSVLSASPSDTNTFFWLHRVAWRRLSAQVMGLRRQKNYAGRWDVLIQQATQCLNRLIEIAARKRRNYILDQVLLLHLHSVVILTTVSQCALMITFSLMDYLFIFQGVSVYYRIEEALIALFSFACHVKLINCSYKWQNMSCIFPSLYLHLLFYVLLQYWLFCLVDNVQVNHDFVKMLRNK